MRFMARLIGLAMLGYGCFLAFKLTWLEHPEMTNRALWINYPGTLASVLVLVVFGYAVIVATNKE